MPRYVWQFCVRLDFVGLIGFDQDAHWSGKSQGNLNLLQGLGILKNGQGNPQMLRSQGKVREFYTFWTKKLIFGWLKCLWIVLCSAFI